MKAILEINGIERPYPVETADLETLLLFVIENELSGEELIVDLSLDGKSYTEAYAHQAREVPLDAVKRVAVTAQTRHALALNFLKGASALLEHIGNGFTLSARLLKDPQREERGQDMLARSLEALQSFKAHLDNVKGFLGKEDNGRRIEDFWRGLNRFADRMIVAQGGKDPVPMAELIENDLLPLLKEWRGILNEMSPL